MAGAWCAAFRTLVETSLPVLDLAIRLVLRAAVALLDLADELVALAVDDRNVIIGELAPALLDLTLELLPVAFNAIPIHAVLLWVRDYSNAPKTAEVPPRKSHARRTLSKAPNS